MQIVIDIPEEMYRTVQDGTYCGSLYEELKNGTPLPKGHGRIIDESKITQIKWETIEEEFESRLQGTIKHRYPVFKGSDAPTIIEADKKERPDNICTQRCCLKNHNIGIIECDEECSNRTSF